MDNPTSVNVKCRLVGEFIDDATDTATTPTSAKPPARGENVRARMVGEFVDEAETRPPVRVRKFVVLFKDKRTVTVRGTALKYVPNGDSGSYGVVTQDAGHEAYVALFQVADLSGIF